MKNKLSIILLFAIALFSGCEKVPEGTEIHVSGNAKAVNTGKPIPSGLVLVQEYVYLDFKSTYTKTIDSMATDEFGNYNITFKSTGNAVEYKVAFRSPSNYAVYYSPQLLDFKKENKVDFNGDRLTVIKAHFNVINNPNPPLMVSLKAPWFLKYNYQLNEKSVDTVIYVYNLGKTMNYFHYSINDLDSPSVLRRGIDSLYLNDYPDTIEHAFQIDPSTFK